MSVTGIHWDKLEVATGTAEDIPSLLEQLVSSSTRDQREAIKELAAQLVEDGFRYHASFLTVPLLAPRLAHLGAKALVGALRLLGAIAVGSPTRATYATAERPAPWDGSVDAECYRAVERVLPHVLPSLSHKAAAVRAAAVSLLTVVPSVDGRPIEACRTDVSPLVRGLAAFALARRAPLYCDGIGLSGLQAPASDPIERALLLAARMILAPTVAKARSLFRALPIERHVADFEWEDENPSWWALTLLSHATTTGFERDYLSLVESELPSAESPDALLVTIVKSLFAMPPGVSARAHYLPRAYAQLSKAQQQFVRMLASQTKPRVDGWWHSDVSDALAREGLPVHVTEPLQSSYQRNLRQFVGDDPPGLYFRELRDAETRRNEPLFAWARLLALGLVGLEEMSRALATLPPKQLVASIGALLQEPHDLRSTPGYRISLFWDLALRAYRLRAEGVAKLLEGKRAHLYLHGYEAVPMIIFALERGVLPAGELEKLHTHLQPWLDETSVALVRHALGLVSPDVRRNVLSRVPFEVPDPDVQATVSRWELVDLWPDRVEAARQLVQAVRALPATEQVRVALHQRIRDALRALRSEVDGVLSESDHERTPWDDVLRDGGR